MELIRFLIRYTPFWAIPLFMISIEFSYIYWLKSIRRVARGFLLLALVCLLACGYYFFTGGPVGAVKMTVTPPAILDFTQ